MATKHAVTEGFLSSSADPAGVALVTTDQSWPYERLSNLVEEATTTLRAIPDDRVCLPMGPSAESVALVLAMSQETGHLAVLISPSAAPSELDRLLRATGTETVMAVEGWPSEKAADPRRTRALASVLTKDRENKGVGKAEMPADAFICQLSSGSLGLPTPAVRTRKGVMAEVSAIKERLGLSDADRVLCASSLSHSYGLIGGLLTPLFAGAMVGIAVDPDQACRLAISLKPTVIFGLASTYRALLNRESASEGLSQVRAVFSAGAPLPRDLYEAFLSRSGISIRQDYGTTESGTISLDFPGPGDPDAVGTPLSHLDVQIDGRGRSDTGEVGEIRVRGEAVAPVYFDEGELHSAVDGVGWYQTGDLGSWDENGRLRLGRRLRPAIEGATGTVAPDRIEFALESLPGIDRAAVLPVKIGSAKAFKAIVVAPGLEAEQVENLCRRLLPPGDRPSFVEVRDELPLSPAGKILHRYL